MDIWCPNDIKGLSLNLDTWFRGKYLVVNDEEKIPVWCKSEDWCALKSTSKILGHKWVPVIAYSVYNAEEARFSELQEDVGGITNKTLSNNLDRMEEQGIIDRNVEDEKPVKIIYSLTDFGEKLMPLVQEMLSWGQDNLREGNRGNARIK